MMGSLELLQCMIIIALFVVLPIYLGSLCSKIMKKKNRSSLAGWLLGLLLSVIGLIITVLLSPNDMALKQQQVINGELKLCIACKEPINRYLTICPHCNADQYNNQQNL